MIHSCLLPIICIVAETEEHVPKSRICIVDIDGDESRRLLRFDRIGGVDGTRSVYHYCSVMLFASSGYRGIAPTIACAWVEPLTRSDAERRRGTGREMRPTALGGLGW